MSSSNNIESYTESIIETYRGGRGGRGGGGGGRSSSRSGSRSGGYRPNNRGTSISSILSSSSSDLPMISDSKFSMSFNVNNNNYYKKIPTLNQSSTSNTNVEGRGGGIGAWENPYWGWEGEEHSWMYPLEVKSSEIISISEQNELIKKKKKELEKEKKQKK